MTVPTGEKPDKNERGIFASIAEGIRRPFGRAAIHRPGLNARRVSDGAAEWHGARHLEVMSQLGANLDKHEGSSPGAAFAILAALEQRYPGSVRGAKELEQDSGAVRKIYVAHLSTEPQVQQPLRPVVVLEGAAPFELPDYPGSQVPRVQVTIGEDGVGELSFSRPKQPDGSQFTSRYEITDTPHDEQKEQAVQSLLSAVYSRVVNSQHRA